jgi:hypothetical protein
MLYLSITYSKDLFIYQTRTELYKAMDSMDFGAFDIYEVNKVSEAIAFYTLEVERDLTKEELEAIKKMYNEAKG